MNAADLHEHYAAVRRRISGVQKRAVCAPPPAPKIDVEKGMSIREQGHIRSLSFGVPVVAEDTRASIIHMLHAYNIPWLAIVGRDRTQKVVKCRRVIVWILHLRGWSTTRIGRLLNRDHTSIIHALDTINPRRTRLDTNSAKAQENSAGNPVRGAVSV